MILESMIEAAFEREGAEEGEGAEPVFFFEADFLMEIGGANLDDRRCRCWSVTLVGSDSGRSMSRYLQLHWICGDG